MLELVKYCIKQCDLQVQSWQTKVGLRWQ